MDEHVTRQRYISGAGRVAITTSGPDSHWVTHSFARLARQGEITLAAISILFGGDFPFRVASTHRLHLH